MAKWTVPEPNIQPSSVNSPHGPGPKKKIYNNNTNKNSAKNYDWFDPL